MLAFLQEKGGRREKPASPRAVRLQKRLWWIILSPGGKESWATPVSPCAFQRCSKWPSGNEAVSLTFDSDVTESQFFMLMTPAISDSSTSHKLVFWEVKLGPVLNFIISWNVCLRKKLLFIKKVFELVKHSSNSYNSFQHCKLGDVIYILRASHPVAMDRNSVCVNVRPVIFPLDNTTHRNCNSVQIQIGYLFFLKAWIG